MKYILTLAIVFATLFGSANDSIKVSDRSYVRNVWDDGWHIALSPLHWKKKQWQQFGMVTAATGALFLLDKPVKNAFDQCGSSTLDGIAEYGLEPWGTTEYYRSYSMGLTAGLLTVGLITDNDHLVKTSEMLVEGMAITLAAAYAIKLTAGRNRPEESGSSHDWRPFSGNKSFVSGHASQMFVVATIMAEQFRETKWIPIVSYSIAGLGSLSRLYENEHWLSDVAVGGMLGYLIGKSVYKLNQSRHSKIMPLFSQVQGQMTYGLAYNF